MCQDNISYIQFNDSWLITYRRGIIFGKFIMMNISSIGEVIQKRRIFLKIDQKGLSELSGVAIHTISNIESGRGNPTVSILNKILVVLGMELQIKVEGNES